MTSLSQWVREKFSATFRITSPSGGGVDSEELRGLVETWRRKESEQGSVPYGSLDKARTYGECAEELEEVIEQEGDESDGEEVPTFEAERIADPKRN